MREAREATEAIECGYDNIGKVLTGCGPGGANLWGQNIGAVGSDT